ncbi:hypothetical protein C8R44DRAFT_882549 [Mycena epipterygia]|nr:hypothetical protein C8R44DRAFT_882549 [Mycena epipterygia]
MAGVLSIFMYLGSILVLHVTTPALFSLETFNSTQSDLFRTQGLPVYPWPDHAAGTSAWEEAFINLTNYTLGSLVFFPPVVESPAAPGLWRGTLYEVVDINNRVGHVTVNATGFNITCGYVDHVVQKFSPEFGQPQWEIQEREGNSSLTYRIFNTPPGVVVTSSNASFVKSVLLYSTIPIVDSENTSGPSINLIPPMNTSIQLLRCSQSIVNQKAVMDAQSWQIITVEPDIEKNVSSWLPYAGPYDGREDNDGWPLSLNSTAENLLLEAWGLWYSYLPKLSVNSDARFELVNIYNVADLYLNAKLNLFPMDARPSRTNVTLHELENALSVIAASMFWTIGHNAPVTPLSINISEASGSLVRYPDSDQSISGPVLLGNGTAAATKTFTRGRLNLSIIAVMGGLGASIALMFLSLPYSFPPQEDNDDNDISIDGTGILHTIWLYRNHPELERSLDQVENPTTDNLRKAGEVLRLLKTEDQSRPSIASTSEKPLLRSSHHASQRSGMESSKSLRRSSLILHSIIVAIHLALVGIWANKLEHQATFSLEQQSMISFAITAITTTFGVMFSALLVLVTQKLSMRRNIKMDQALTATHDTAAAWAGIGSSISCLWNQRTLPATTVGVLSILLYLGSILALHITTPALFALETFNSTRSVSVGTQGLPAYKWPSNISNSVDGDSAMFAAIRNLEEYAGSSLAFFPPVVESAKAAGLWGGTVYEVPDVNTTVGNVTVNATGFNISCRYMNNMEVQYSSNHWEIMGGNGDSSGSYGIYPTPPGIISEPMVDYFYNNSVVLYSTIPIVDSDNQRGPSINLIPPMATSVSSIQLLWCSQALVNQKALVDSQSWEIITVEPDIEKNVSAWIPYAGPYDASSDSGNLFLDLWAIWYEQLPVTSIITSGLDPLPEYSSQYLYLIQKLNLLPTDAGPLRANVTLHELENALSVIVASMFWTLSYKPAVAPLSINVSEVNGSLLRYPYSRQSTPFRLNGTATLTVMVLEGRLDLNIIAVGAGLTASIALLLLSFSNSFRHRVAENDSDDVLIDGTGILHAIWLYRNHPELETLLEQVEYPTDDNLRDAGMVRVMLVGGRGDCSEFDAGVGPTRAFDLADDDGSSLLAPRSFIIDAGARDSGFYDNNARDSRSSAANLAYPAPFALSSTRPHPVYADSRPLYTETPTLDKDKMRNATLDKEERAFPAQPAGCAHGPSPALPLPPPPFPARALSIPAPPLAFPAPPSAFSAAPASADKSESPFHADLYALSSHSHGWSKDRGAGTDGGAGFS